MECAVPVLSHILRLFFACLIAFQLGRAPTGIQAATNQYMCSPSGQAPSAEAVNQLELLFAAAGKTLPKQPAPTHHCDNCLTSSLGMLPQQLTVKIGVPQIRAAHYFPLSIGFDYTPQGPPLGGRAPPLFV